MDGWDFKSYVLGILFYRFISENIANYVNKMQREAGAPDFDYADFPDEEAESARQLLVAEKGFFILPSQLFCNVKKRAADDPNLNVTLDEIFKSIEASAVGTKSEDDLAFTMHMLAWLSTDGTAAIVEFPGVLYRGGKEQKIRRYLVDNNYVECVIQLPQNLFFGVGIATCIIVLKKSKRDNKTLFIDEGNKNKLSPENITEIVEEYALRKEIKHFSSLVDIQTIAENGYNLSVSSYVEPEDTRPQIDIKELNARIARIVEHENRLRAEIDAIIKELDSDLPVKGGLQ